MVLLLVAAPFSCTKPQDDTVNNKTENQTNPGGDKEGEDDPQTPVLNSISVNPTEVTLEEGQTKILILTLDPADYSREGIQWTSSATGIATVVNGTITAVAEGEATVKVTLAGKEASCKVTVTKKETPAEWDGKTFTDRTAEWESKFQELNYKDVGGDYDAMGWFYSLISCTTPYFFITYICENEDMWGTAPVSIRQDPINIADAYNYYCVDVDDSYLMSMLFSTLPYHKELIWPDGEGYAHGYVFGFDKNKKFTGEYAHVKSDKQF